LLGGALLVSMVAAGCGGTGVNPALPQAAEHQLVGRDEAETEVAAEDVIDLVAEVDDDSAAILLVADNGDPQPAQAPPVSIRSVRSLAPEPAATRPMLGDAPARVEAPAVVVRDDSVSSASYRAAAPSSALEPAAGNMRSPALAAILQQAEAHTQQGLELANRGAHFSARAEFVQALRLVSQGLDGEQRSSRHGIALAAGMRAIEEADDLVPRGARLEGEIDVFRLTRPHQTPVLKEMQPGELAPQAAAERYYAYAEEQLAAAVAPEPTASMALYAIGKLHSLLASQKSPIIVAAEAKSVVFYQAAMLTDPNNAMAANDLAVLLARMGRYPQARALLIRAAQQAPQAAVWHNLAVVHAQLGEERLAQLAHNNAVAAGNGVDPANAQAVAAMESVKWVDPQTFASSTRPATDMPMPSPPRAGGQAAAPVPASAEQPPTRMSRWFPWGQTQR
jgi:tetratricopeptide (TPR) repeat protein